MPIPNSLPWMESVDTKIARAHEHLTSLEEAIAAYQATVKRTLILKLNAEQTAVSLMTWVDDPYPPMRIGGIVGDCVYNTRAALDNLVCGLVRTSEPASDCKDTKFPIIADANRWASAGRSLRGVPQAAIALVKSVQPFNRPPGSEELDPLNILNKLRNRDVHRAALLTSGYSRNTRFAIHADDGAVVYVTSDQPLFGEGFNSIPLPIEPSRIGPSARVQAMGTSVLAFRDEGPWRDRSVVDVVGGCLRHVEDVLRMFQPFFRPGSPPGKV